MNGFHVERSQQQCSKTSRFALLQCYVSAVVNSG
jgi:hypothetical protein